MADGQLDLACWSFSCLFFKIYNAFLNNTILEVHIDDASGYCLVL